jgi:TusA-related sulfurtransferase
MSVVDMPVFCAQAGHRVVSEAKDGERFVFVIEKRSDLRSGLSTD